MPTRTISGTATQLVPQNFLRKSIIVQNQDTTQIVFLKREAVGTTVTTTDHDVRIGVLETFSMTLNEDGQEDVQDRYTVVADGGTPRISIKETIDAPVIKEFRQ